MRGFTQEEKNLIVNTPITIDCFDFEEDRTNRNYLPEHEGSDAYVIPITYTYQSIAWQAESLREAYLCTKEEKYFDALVRLLPNSYKVVKL